MAEEQSSLRKAVDSIMGWGQQPQAQQGPVQLTKPLTTSAISNVITPAAPSPFESQLAGIQAQNAALSAKLAPAAIAPAAAVASAAASPLKRISYTEFYKGRPEAADAMKYLGYGFYSKPTETTMGAGANWSANPGGNPYQYRNEYNTYLGSLAPKTPYAMNKAEVDAARAALR